MITHLVVGALGLAGGALIGGRAAISPSAPSSAPAATPPEASRTAGAALGTLPAMPAVRGEATAGSAACEARASTCETQLAQADLDCQTRAWNAGFALPRDWPEGLEGDWAHDAVEAKLEAAVDRCIPESTWSMVDCSEYPCTLFYDGGATDGNPVTDCEAAWPDTVPWSSSMANADGEVVVRSFYPLEGVGKREGRDARRETFRLKDAFKLMREAHEADAE